MRSPIPAIEFELLRTDNNSYGPEWNGLRLNDDYYRLYVILEGRAEVTLEGEQLDLRAGHSYLFAKTKSFGYRCPEHFRLMNVCFDMRLPSALDILDIQPHLREIALEDIAETQARMARIGTEMEARSYGIQLEIRGLLMQMLGPHFRAPMTEAILNRRRRLERLRPALDRIHGDIGGKIDITQLGRLANMSRSYFAKQFGETFHMSAQDYVRRQRIEQAKKLLQKTRMTIATISSDLGFSNPSHFSREFRLHTGMPPKEFRAQDTYFE